VALPIRQQDAGVVAMESRKTDWLLWTTVLLVSGFCTANLIKRLGRSVDMYQLGWKSEILTGLFYDIALLILVAVFSIGALMLRRWGRVGLIAVLLLITTERLIYSVRIDLSWFELRRVGYPPDYPMTDFWLGLVYPLGWVMLSVGAFWVLYRSSVARRFG
jgi:hypothetical protein